MCFSPSRFLRIKVFNLATILFFQLNITWLQKIVNLYRYEIYLIMEKQIYIDLWLDVIGN